MYGWRGRLGLIVPSSNTTCEMEFHRVLPEGVSVHTARCFLSEGDVPGERVGEILRMNEGLLEAARQVASVQPDVVVWACTVGSFVSGTGYDAELARRMTEAVHVPVVTTSGAVVEALAEIGATRLAMATPYIEEINKREKRFLEASLPNLEVVQLSGAGIVGNLPKGRLSPESAYAAGKTVDTAAADCVFISCTNWRTLEILEPLEQNLRKPVISSVQATIWRTFRTLGLPNLRGYGRLLERIQANNP